MHLLTRPGWFAAIALSAAAWTVGCSASERRFALRDPMWRDTDLASVWVRCHPEPSAKEPRHVSCAPRPYDSPLYWDGGDNIFFRPLSELLGVATSGESVNANSFDEVPDSSWFINRLGRHPMTLEEVARGACRPEQILDPAHAPDASWLVDKGKTSGSTPGFRVTVPGKGKYLLKAESLEDSPEREAASSIIGADVYYAAGYNASCEQVIYIRPSLLQLEPGLVYRQSNFGELEPFDRKALDAILANSTKRGDLVRMSASAWIPGYSIGSYRYEGTRDDDPNDVIPHQDRRELRGMRLLAAWIDRHDAREGNTLDTWMADAKRPPDSSPGHVVHYQLDTSEALGSVWGWDPISRRLGHSYVIDWGDIAADFLTLGIATRPWDTVEKKKGREIFGYFNVRDFVPDAWKNEYPNPAFSRATERDNAWMARILSRFTPEMLQALAAAGDFTDAGNTAYVAAVLEGRLHRILERYLLRLSPIADVTMDGTRTVCGVDLAELRGVRDASNFHYRAAWRKAGLLAVEKRPGAKVCVTAPHFAADGGARDDAAERYVRIVLDDGVAAGPLVVHLYDLGPTRGYRIAGLERPDP